MRKYVIILFISVFCKAYASGGGDFYDDYYYNLFMQEIVGDAQYFPFLLANHAEFYENAGNAPLKNENIEEWSNYLKISYNNAYYLVFKAKKTDIDALIAGQSINNDTLHFANADFVKKHTQALKYISYSKFLEPYMHIPPAPNSWWANDSTYISIKRLDYNKIKNTLLHSWNAETDKELKLRYGYQLVRLAHYNGNYEEAIDYFKKYVQSLNHKTIMYYYALDQKAGAERGSGNFEQASRDYLTVFHHVRNIKESVYMSLKFCSNSTSDDNYTWSDFPESLLKSAKNDDERNDVYFLLGRLKFSNPLCAIEKIVKTAPDAVQAKVLLARVVNYVEREYLPTYTALKKTKNEVESVEKLSFWDKIVNFFRKLFSKPKKEKINTNDERRLPLSPAGEIQTLTTNTLQLIENHIKANQIADKNFWNYTAAYLHFLQKNYPKSKEFLENVTETDSVYQNQKTQLAMLIDICDQPIIDQDFEQILFTKYKTVFEQNSLQYRSSWWWDETCHSTFGFIVDILANRYYIQKEYAKAFLLQNDLNILLINPDLQLISNIETLYHKKGKSPMEQYLAKKMAPDIDEFIAYIRGNVYLAQGNFEKAFSCFENVSSANYNNYSHVPCSVFGYNRVESFSSEENFTMSVDYLSDFQFIKENMSEKELAKSLVELQKTGKKDSELAAKANYLIGNFLYNTSSTGYYRHILRFDGNNMNCDKYRSQTKPDFSKNVYFKNYFEKVYFPDTLSLPNKYLERALSLAKDDELKARIAFALSKVEQEAFYIKNGMLGWYWWRDGEAPEGDGILIKNRKYFRELQKYAHTGFYEEVRTNCLYFDYYVEHF